MQKLNKIYKWIKSFTDGFADRYLVTFAASGAFFMFLSLFPIATLAVSILPYTNLTEASLLSFLGEVLPKTVMSLLQTVVTYVYDKSITTLSISILVILWSSGQAFSELIKGMMVVCDSPVKVSFLRRRLRAVLFTLVFLLSMLLTLSILIFGRKLAGLIIVSFPQTASLMKHLIRLRFLVMAAYLLLMFLMMYKSIPGLKFRFREVFAGAAFATVAWIAFSALFSVYVTSIGNFTIYGSLATMVITMLWLYYCHYIILIGAYLSSYLRKLPEKPKKEKSKKRLFSRKKKTAA